MYCSNCGAEIGEMDVFCRHCGTSVKAGSNKMVMNERKLKQIIYVLPFFVITVSILISIFAISKNTNILNNQNSSKGMQEFDFVNQNLNNPPKVSVEKIEDSITNIQEYPHKYIPNFDNIRLNMTEQEVRNALEISGEGCINECINYNREPFKSYVFQHDYYSESEWISDTEYSGSQIEFLMDEKGDYRLNQISLDKSKIYRFDEAMEIYTAIQEYYIELPGCSLNSIDELEEYNLWTTDFYYGDTHIDVLLNKPLNEYYKITLWYGNLKIYPDSF